MANPVLTRGFDSTTATTDASFQQVEVPGSVTGAARMTMRSVLTSTVVLLALVIGGATWGWQNAIAVQRWFWLWIIVLLVLVVITVVRPHLAMFTGIIYALGQGAFIGSISRIYEEFVEGIVFQALLATVAVFIAMLFLYATRIIKVTEKTRSVIIVATFGIVLFYLFSWLMRLFGVDVPLVFGIGTTAIVFSAIVIIVAALNLLLDFDVIERGIAAGAPKAFSWFAAFGLMVTIIWLYIEILRLLAILAARR